MEELAGLISDFYRAGVARSAVQGAVWGGGKDGGGGEDRNSTFITWHLSWQLAIPNEKLGSCCGAVWHQGTL